MRNRQKKGGGKIIGVLILVGFILGAGYLYTSPAFERVAPQIIAQNGIYWNKKAPIKVNLKDNIGLKSFQLVLSDGQKSIIVGKGEFEKGITAQTLLVNYPKSQVLDPRAKELKLQISVVDQSMWNMLKGNQQSKVIDIHVDDKRPNIEIVANSYSITQGGSALVVLQAIDEHLKEVYIQTPTKKFKAQPYKEKGYYAALIAWPFNQDHFSAKVVATDIAQNRSDKHVPLYLRTHQYKVSWIKASDRFIDGKISDLASTDPEYGQIDKRLEKLRAINETMRLKNEELIHKYASKTSAEMLGKWKVKRFYPLKNGAKVASYGDERHYYYADKSQEVSRSYHVGYDLASTKMATIRSSNPGKVVFAEYNGIYGNMPMIDHGLGLYTLYGHCSKLMVKEGDAVQAEQAIAKTGTSGLALGDHLHFGILVQGIEVRPVEWFDAAWIKTNIDDVFAQADKVIED
jgi:murein DD-endopeptidase MepM/ murein hydrolase activator NlpD